MTTRLLRTAVTRNSRLNRIILPQAQSPASLCLRRCFSNGIVQENDIVLLRRVDDPSKYTPILTEKLCFNGKTEAVRDHIHHDSIIGKTLRQLVRSRRGKDYRIYEPTLAEYTDLSPRVVTPIYSQDAAAIVELLDLHPTTPDLEEKNSSDERLEIFEAGTGHGALTLNLSRAIHGANTCPPMASGNDTICNTIDTPVNAQGRDPTEPEDSATLNDDLQGWRDNRRAVIHTLDCSLKHSRYAEKTIKKFRDGLYYNNIDFHVGSIKEYISDRLVHSQGKPFLDHAILDLPACHEYMGITGTALKHNGSLLVFCPSITQINTAVLHCKSNGFPLYLENVLELGAGAGVGGREWDVRPVRPRAFMKARAEEQKTRGEDAVVEHSEDLDSRKDDESRTDNDGWELVCRPKVGVRVQGGGFVAQWRKMTAMREEFSERHLKLF